MTDDQIRVKDFKSRKRFAKVTGSKDILLPRNLNRSTFAFGIVVDVFESDFLQIQDDVCYIFLDARNGGKFVSYAIDSDGGYCKTFKRRKQYTTQSVADGNTITRLQWTEFEFAKGVGGFQH